MTHLHRRLLEEIERRNYTQSTAHTYVEAVRRFAEYFDRSPELLGIDHVRRYQLHRLEQKVKPHSVAVETSALRFLYNKVLRRRYSVTTCRCPEPIAAICRSSSAPTRSPA